MNTSATKPILHSFDGQNKPSAKKKLLTALIIILTGIGSGFLLSRFINRPGSSGASSILDKTGQKLSVGVDDSKTFRDSAEGELEIGGINGEGTHKLIRPGGESQSVYLTSTVLDLNQFTGKSVKVWGETFAAKKAGWLMDVGKIEVLQ